jgi:hypothetical protein
MKNRAKRRQYERLCHFKGGKGQIFHHKIINMQDHGVVALVDMKPTSRKTSKSEFL